MEWSWRVLGYLTFGPEFQTVLDSGSHGAMSAPGPTHMIGGTGSSGRVINPLEIPTRIMPPFDEISSCKTRVNRNLPGTRVDNRMCTLLSVGLSGGFCS